MSFMVRPDDWQVINQFYIVVPLICQLYKYHVINFETVVKRPYPCRYSESSARGYIHGNFCTHSVCTGCFVMNSHSSTFTKDKAQSFALAKKCSCCFITVEELLVELEIKTKPVCGAGNINKSRLLCWDLYFRTLHWTSADKLQKQIPNTTFKTRTQNIHKNSIKVY